MEIKTFIAGQLPERQKLMSELHDIIIQGDKKVTATIEPMMGKEMIIYKCKGIFKYGLSGVKNHMSLHAMPIYANTELHNKYAALLNGASFQKGCINFKDAEAMPLKTAKQFIADCAKIDMIALMEKYKKKR